MSGSSSLRVSFSAPHAYLVLLNLTFLPAVTDRTQLQPLLTYCSWISPGSLLLPIGLRCFQTSPTAYGPRLLLLDFTHCFQTSFACLPSPNGSSCFQTSPGTSRHCLLLPHLTHCFQSSPAILPSPNGLSCFQTLHATSRTCLLLLDLTLFSWSSSAAIGLCLLLPDLACCSLTSSTYLPAICTWPSCIQTSPAASGSHQQLPDLIHCSQTSLFPAIAYWAQLLSDFACCCCLSIWEGYKATSKQFKVHHSIVKKIIQKGKTFKAVAVLHLEKERSE
ncbi:uncharacterized protein LOC131183920 [Ahaetulla prasina]|uniref:uncharacterized protein LOC131183920 n=1 Tax=Ahaetulla prasina TaxID=499056 RepID=UPI0026496AFB|nr:uncharacterized protein LOC131183920 [Ahaetulla prasina]